MALAWLAAQRRLYQLRDFGLGDSPLLATQVTLPAAGTIAVLAMPVAWLVGTPAYLPAWLVQPGRRPRLARAAADRRGRRVVSRPGLAGQRDPRRSAALLLGIGVLVACHVGRFNRPPARTIGSPTIR